MRINYKNTAIGFLDEPETMDYFMPEYHTGSESDEWEAKFKEGLKKIFVESKGQLFNDRVQYISKPFLAAYEKAKSKLVSIFDKEELNECGTLIYVDETGSWTTTIFYSIKTTGTGDDWDADVIFIQFSKHSQAEQKGLDVFIKSDGDQSRSLIYKNHYDAGYDRAHFVAWLVTFLCFIKCCEIETKVIESNRKVKHNGEKYLNETKRNVEILDSRWFTTIVSSKGFSVGAEDGGFSRRQPYGPNNSLRRLIWVPAFEKKGYTSKARVLLDQNK